MKNKPLRYLIAAALLCAVSALPVNAQFTLVSGTVTDPNGLPWACGTISATLINNNGVSATLNGQIIQGFTAPVKLGCPTDPTTSRTAGFFQMQLADNTVIKCGIATCGIQTTWQFTVNTTGIAPPQGTGPQSFSQAFTISGATQTLTFTNVPALSLSSGASPASFSANAILATAPKYNLPQPAKWVCDATFNGTTTVTTPGTDIPFLATDSFAIVWGGTAFCGGNPQTSITTLTAGTCPGGAAGCVTATFVSAHQITLSIASGSCTPTTGQGGCALVWGPDHTAAVQSAWNDAVAGCGMLYIPQNVIFTSVITATSLCPATDGVNDNPSGLGVMGAGPNAMFLFAPGFNFSTPMFGVTGGSVIRRLYHDFGIASFTSATAGMANQTAFSVAFNSEVHHIWAMDFFPSASTAFTAFNINGVLNAITKFHDNLFINAGGVFGGVVFNNSDVDIYENWIQGGQRGFSFGIGGSRNKSYGNRVTLINGNQGALSQGSGALDYDSWDDVFSAQGTTLPAVAFTGSGSTIRFHNVQIAASPTGAANGALQIAAANTVIIEGEFSSVALSTANGGSGPGITNAGTLTLRNVAVSSGNGVSLSNSGTATIKDGNTFPNGITNTGTLIVPEGVGGHNGGCTGTVATGNNGLNLNSVACAVALGGTIMGKAGTVYAIYGTSSAAGSTASDALTLFKNGVSTALTCSMNGATSCSDGTAAHQVSYVSSDRLQLVAVAGAASTMANPVGLFVAP